LSSRRYFRIFGTGTEIEHSESSPQFQLGGLDSESIGDLRGKRIATDETFVSILLLAAVMFLDEDPEILA
jgi:hypothetical protein